jgi:hypothetical protein
MVDYTALKAEWATITTANPGFTTAQKLAAVNALTVAGPNVDVPVADAVLFLANEGKWAALAVYGQKALASLAAGGALTTAQSAGAQFAALMQSSQFTAFKTSTSAGMAAITAMLNAVASDAASGISLSDVAALLALAANPVPWWSATVAQGGGGLSSPVGMSDLSAAPGGLT